LRATAACPTFLRCNLLFLPLLLFTFDCCCNAHMSEGSEVGGGGGPYKYGADCVLREVA